MESNTSIGREQKGYETLIAQESYDIKQGDIITIFQNKYIVQYITRYAKEGYLEIQMGIDVK
jgi:ribosomal 50S subunit-recycling heat shock protein